MAGVQTRRPIFLCRNVFVYLKRYNDLRGGLNKGLTQRVTAYI